MKFGRGTRGATLQANSNSFNQQIWEEAKSELKRQQPDTRASNLLNDDKLNPKTKLVCKEEDFEVRQD